MHQHLHQSHKESGGVAIAQADQPTIIIEPGVSHVIEKRASSPSCTPGDSSAQCEKPVSSTTGATLPIALGAAIPIVVAIVLFVYLHRRHVKKLRREDKNDKTISLDFGLGPGDAARKLGNGRGNKGRFGRKAKPEMLDTSQPLKRPGPTRGLSMDIDMGSPYLLPPELHDSTSSLHSLTRTLKDDDKYQPVNFVRSGAITPVSPYGSVRSFAVTAKSGMEDFIEPSSASRINHKDPFRRSLINGASAMATSTPPHTSQGSEDTLVADQSTGGAKQNGANGPGTQPNSFTAPRAEGSRDSYIAADNGNMRRSHMHLAGFINPGEVSSAQEMTVSHEEAMRTTSQLHKAESVFEPGAEGRSSPTEVPTQNRQTRDFSRPMRTSSSQASQSNRNSRQSSAGIDNHGNFHAPPSPIKEEQHDEGDYMGNSNQYQLPALDLGEGRGPEDNYDHYQQYDQPDPGSQTYGDYQHYDQYEPNQPYDANQAYGVKAAAYALEGGQSERHGDHPSHQDGLLGVQSEDPHRLSMGFRPLPPDDPADDPEQRANRIRSFYKEYFAADDSRERPPMPSLPQQQQSRQDYYEDYGQEYMNQAPMEDGIMDPETGYFYPAPTRAPYAMPMSRRAMTPPPRAPPRFRGGSGHSFRPRGQSSSSGAGFHPPGPRAMSSASGQFGPPRGRRPAPKPMTPPAPLKTLPTPHRMKDDSALFDASMFAPPPTHADIASGSRPASPLGERRNYKSPKTGHNPLVSSYDELPAVPSPHQMRRSGTFTALDFAPPRRQAKENASDAGSIRSNRTGISQTNMYAIRNGAYRISRLPEQMVPKKKDMANNLRPTWDMRRNMV